MGAQGREKEREREREGDTEAHLQNLFSIQPGISAPTSHACHEHEVWSIGLSQPVVETRELQIDCFWIPHCVFDFAFGSHPALKFLHKPIDVHQFLCDQAMSKVGRRQTYLAWISDYSNCYSIARMGNKELTFVDLVIIQTK